MDIVLLIFVSFGASWLTFFCGFGLGTMLTPIFFLLFNDITLAIAATAVVHFLNNVFKYLLMKRSVDWKILIPFAVAAIPAAFVGALLVTKIEDVNLISYGFLGFSFDIYLLNLVFGAVLIVFALIELIPAWGLAFSKKSLWIGGLVSGFFGGLSGHQGALRTAFLIQYNLKKEVFIATGIVVALVIDVVRTSVYVSSFDYEKLGENWFMITLSLIAALVGAITGRFYLKKIKLESLNRVVAIGMLIFGLTLALGILQKNDKKGDQSAIQIQTPSLFESAA